MKQLMSQFTKSFFALQKSSIVLTLKGSIDITYSIFHQTMSIYPAKEHLSTPVVTLNGFRILIKHLLFTYYYRTLLLVNVFLTPAIRYNLIMIRLITVDIENTQYIIHTHSKPKNRPLVTTIRIHVKQNIPVCRAIIIRPLQQNLFLPGNTSHFRIIFFGIFFVEPVSEYSDTLSVATATQELSFTGRGAVSISHGELLSETLSLQSLFFYKYRYRSIVKQFLGTHGYFDMIFVTQETRILLLIINLFAHA